jgi:hypothetical protein
MPGCRRQAIHCDLDHTIPHPRGSTTPANLGPLCRRHHNLKTHHGWHLANDPPDPDTGHTPGYTWTTPAGTTSHHRITPPLE